MDSDRAGALEITVNAKPVTTGARNIGELLAELQLAQRHVSVMVNERVQPRATRAEVPLRPGDRIDIIAMVGGG